MAIRVGVILLITLLLGGGVDLTSPVHGAPAAASSYSARIGLDLKGSFTESTQVTGFVTGVPGPGPSGLPQELLVIVRINGLTVEFPGLAWDYQDGVWEFTYRIPAGSASSIISISVIGPDGYDVGRSFTVGP